MQLPSLVLVLFSLVLMLAGGAASEASVDRVAQESVRTDPPLAVSVEEFLKSAEKADAAFRDALEDVLASISDRRDVEERLALETAIRAQGEAFLASGRIPAHPDLRRMAEKLVGQVSPSADACHGAHTKEAERLLNSGQTDAARGVVEDRNALLRSSPYWLPAIPPHVRTNIDALRAHRPDFTNGLDSYFEAVKKAGRGTNRLRFRVAVDEALDATAATEHPGEPAGNPNCRDDLKLVLETLRAGEWDLRELRFHERNHLRRRTIKGLPGLRYD